MATMSEKSKSVIALQLIQFLSWQGSLPGLYSRDKHLCVLRANSSSPRMENNEPL